MFRCAQHDNFIGLDVSTALCSAQHDINTHRAPTLGHAGLPLYVILVLDTRIQVKHKKLLSVAKHPGLIYTFSPENIPRFRFSLFCAFLWCGRAGR